ncbi:HNH endonuclease [Vibrio alginolyticus]|uniref:HNH endonuclease n=1 Tax=Vibrio alginolyticus TaxID=663 RepID=UPI00215C6295|nr:HNH endonuclease signature motif containing protein [Vibrio alginolyticus]MCR9529262.1 HNH endonuclease [Vibrio alginolyticus]
MNKKRKIIWDKTGGKCFYCGSALPEKGWHADHFHPIVRDIVINSKGDGYTTGNGCSYPELDTIDNLVPSCAPCNNFKHSYSIDGYRMIIAEQFKNTLKNSTGLRQLDRLGLIDLVEKPVEFYFEKAGIKAPCELEIIGISKLAQEVVWHKDHTEPRYYYAEFEGFICSLRHMGSYWLAIAKGFSWEEFGRTEFPNGRHAKFQAADWALRIQEQKQSDA